MQRRDFIIRSAISAIALGTPAIALSQQSKQAAGQAGGTELVLLGTKGGPRVGPNGARRNPANLLLVDHVPYVIDCGYGVAQQLVTAGVPLKDLRYIFLTHLHSDHFLGYGPLIYSAWSAGLKQNVDAFGPPPLTEATKAFMDSMKYDIDIRTKDEGKPYLPDLIKTHEFSEGGELYKDQRVRVTALSVKHPPLKHAFALRFETRDRTVVFSGDTAYVPELADFAKGADILVHEVMYLPAVDAMVKRVPNAATLREHLLASHTLPSDIGRIAEAAQVGMVVLSHLVPGDDPTITEKMWSQGVRDHYHGPVVVGTDLMRL